MFVINDHDANTPFRILSRYAHDTIKFHLHRHKIDDGKFFSLHRRPARQTSFRPSIPLLVIRPRVFFSKRLTTPGTWPPKLHGSGQWRTMTQCRKTTTLDQLNTDAVTVFQSLQWLLSPMTYSFFFVKLSSQEFFSLLVFISINVIFLSHDVCIYI